MSAPYRAAHARKRVGGRVLPGRLGTFVLLSALGQAETARRRHAPFPDLLIPGTCNVCWLELGDPLHWPAWKRLFECWRKSFRGGGGLGPERTGWR